MSTKRCKTIDRTPLRDGIPPLQSTEGNHEIFFQLVATDSKDEKIQPIPAQILRALYEGTIAPDQVSFSLIQINSEENADFHDSCSPVCRGVYESPTNLGIPMGISKQGKSVTITCNPSIISMNEDCEESDVQANFLKGGLQC